MMHQLREKTKAIIVVVAIAFVESAWSSSGASISPADSAELTGGELGRVNGKPIAYEQWASIYQSLYSQRQEASRTMAPAEVPAR